MARDKRPSRHAPEDLTPYTGCGADATVGLDPLAVGWLDRRVTFVTGETPAGFRHHLLSFCFDNNLVCRLPQPRPCPLCNSVVEAITHEGETATLGLGEIRVIGDDNIYAAPNLIYHFVTVHGYQPPAEFIQAVSKGPQPSAPEFRALIKTLQMF